MEKEKKKIEKRASLNSHLRILAEIKHPVREVTIDELVDLMRNADEGTIINVSFEGGEE